MKTLRHLAAGAVLAPTLVLTATLVMIGGIVLALCWIAAKIEGE